MNRETDVERSITAWLAAEAPGRAPREILAAVTARVDRTPQRRRRAVWWRVPVAMPALELGAVVFVLVMIVAGLTLRSMALGGSGAAATPSSGPSPRPAAPGPLEAGVPYTFDLPVPFAFTAPAGWVYGFTRPNGSTIVNSNETAAVGWFVVDNLYRDPCRWQQGTLTPPVGSGVDAMVAALRAMPGFTVTGPTPTTIDGQPAQRLTLVAKVDDRTCDGGQTKVWSWTPTGNQLPLYGGTTSVAVLNVAGTRVLVTSWAALSDPTAATDVTAIVGSTQFR